LLEDRLAPAILTVNTLSDSTGGSQLSLRDAILAVDAGSYSGPATGQVSGTFGSSDTILFQSGLNGTLSLTTASGPLAISSNVTITANPTLNAITISGQFAGSQTGVFEVKSPATATIAGLTITQGKDSTNLFGAIDVQSGGTLTVNGCTFVNNQSAGPGGGAILNAGTLTVTDSTFANNSGVAGGAIDNISGATAALINCTISGNQATTGSGTGGGVANAGTLTLLNTLVAQNTSAGSDPDVVGAFTSSGHNLIGNATGSTGLTNGVNGDQVGSAAPFTGDVTKGLATIDNVSSTAGLAVGQLITDTAGAIPAGTVIAVLGTHSITLSQAATKSQTGDTFTSSVYADLGPLQNNGGGIQTMALLPTGSGIDAGANSDPVLTVPTVDERGVSRPQAGTVDIGAFEANQLLVTNLNDSGAGSLRDALAQSNSIPGTVVIDFQPGLTGTISLTTGHLEIVHDDWVRGPGASQITVDGNLNYWCFGVDSAYTVGAPGLHVAIYGLTMTRGEQVVGLSDGRGGAISYRNAFPFDCRLTVANCVIENSVNGGIYAEDTLSVLNCQIINNTGQGIYGGTPFVSNSWLAGNSKEGLNGDSNVVLANSTFSGNGSDGVYMGNDDATVTNCTFTGNHGRGFVINFEDTAVLTDSTLVGNVGSDLLSIGGNAIPRNCIVNRLDTQNGFGTITSQGNNLFRSAIPPGMTVLASDVRSPGVSTSNAFGGSLRSGTYYYVIGAITAQGTLTSGDWPDSLAFNNMKVTLRWTAPAGISGVTAYRIYRGTALGAERLIATVSAATTGFTDAGAAATSGVPWLLGGLGNNGGLAPTIAPTAAGSVYTRNKGNPAFASLLDERGYLRNPIFPGIGAFESVSATPNTVSLSPASLPAIDRGLGYSQSITASGGTGTGYLIGITAGALPPGLTLTDDGALAGTATTVGSFAFTVTGFDSAGNFGSKNYTLNVNPAPSIATSSLPTGNENAAYTKAILTSGGTGPFTWSYSGTLPGGINFNTSTGTFGGTPAAGSAGTYNGIQVTATDSDGVSTTPQTYSMVIDDVSLGALSFNQWTVNKAGFIGTIAATGTGAFTLRMVGGRLPTSMAVSLGGGLVTFVGRPTVAGAYTFALRLTDSLGVTATQTYTIVINPATTLVWTGLGADANWTTPGNWGGGAAPLAGDTLIFGAGAATAQKTANNNFPNGTLFATLLFQDSGYTIAGNNVRLSAGIRSTSSAARTDTVALNVALTATETFIIVGATLIDITGTIGGTNVGITKVGTGTLAYDSPTGNTYTGPTTVSGGTLLLNTSNQIADATSVTVNPGAVFDLNGHNETIANLTLAGGTVNTGTGTLTLSGTVTSNVAGTDAAINGNLNLTAAAPKLSINNALVIAAGVSAGSLTKLGVGKLVLAGDNSSYVGTTTVSGGVLDVPNPAALGSGPVLALLGATLQLDGNGLTFGNTLTLGSGTGGATLRNLAGSNSWSGPITNAVTSTINVSAGTLTINGAIGGAGGLTTSGPGTLVLPGANSYAGITTVLGGVLDVQTPAALGNNPSLTVAAAGTLQLDGTGLNFGKTLSLSGTLANLNGNNTWSGNIGTPAATSTVNVGTGQSLTLSGIISGAGGLTVNTSGSGTLILTNANTYTGATIIKGGIVVVQNRTALGSALGGTVVSSGATLQVQGGLTIAEPITLNGVGAASTTGALESVAGTNTWTGTVSLAGASTIAIDAGQLTIGGIISGKGSLTEAGAGSLIVSALNTYTGGTTVNGGTLGGGGMIGALLVNSGATLAPSSPTTKIFKTGNVAFSAGSTFAVTLNGTAAGTGYDQLSVTGTVNLAGATLDVNLGFTPAVGSAFVLIQNDGVDAVVGTFAGLPQGATLSLDGMTFQISYVGGTGNDVVLTRTA
jgi:autotransporter-associated beta strand protein